MAVTPKITLGAQPSLSEKLRGVHVGFREDLEVSRHVFRGVASYIVRDPLTFQSQRLSVDDYGLFVRIDADRVLGQVFAECVGDGLLQQDDEERFYEFVLNLHRLGFLRLPLSDEKALYRRHQLRELSKRRERLMGFLYYRIPVLNPDAFLSRTQWLGRLLFTRWFFALWLLLVSSALYVAVGRWHDLHQPLEGVLVASNLPMLWVTMIILKVFHEFGHAYACKRYGGHVPEMGICLILLTPCAYVDASASWGFSRKSERLIVCLAGMYVESTLASLATFAWAMTNTSMIHAIAYNVMFLAGIVTVLFNVNPLMRYDGYYILSDLLEIPNLRPRASRYVIQVLKRLFLGVGSHGEPLDLRTRCLLFGFGVAAGIYRVSLLLVIAAVLAGKWLTLGLILGVGYVGSLLLGIGTRLMRYLWYHPETAPKRWRAVAASVAVFLIAPAVIFWVPLPAHVAAEGVLGPEREIVLRARSPGFLVETPGTPGRRVSAGDPLAVLVNDSVNEAVKIAEAGLRSAELRRDALLTADAARSMQEASQASAKRAALVQIQRQQADLTLTAPEDGLVTQCVSGRDTGSYFPEGTPLATIAAGGWQVRTLVTEEEALRAGAQVGKDVEFRCEAMPRKILHGVIASVAPAGSHTIALASLTHIVGGDIPIDAATRRASQVYFEVLIKLDDEEEIPALVGSVGWVRFRAGTETLGASISRRVLRFWNQLLEGA